ncbi:MAG: hypothetical protein U0894_13625 [Pirellulales bacterium]
MHCERNCEVKGSTCYREPSPRTANFLTRRDGQAGKGKLAGMPANKVARRMEPCALVGTKRFCLLAGRSWFGSTACVRHLPIA